MGAGAGGVVGGGDEADVGQNDDVAYVVVSSEMEMGGNFRSAISPEMRNGRERLEDFLLTSFFGKHHRRETSGKVGVP